MAPSPLSYYTQTIKNQADKARLLVVGNQGADLDSIASALVLAWHLTHQQPANGAVPLIATGRHDLRLRPEVTFVLEQAGIEASNLLFIDDSQVAAMLARGVDLVLVDHNGLEPGLPLAQQRVAAIIDHHQDEGHFADAKPRLIDQVGSTATLVAELVFTNEVKPDKAAALLLLSAILIDTVNLSSTAGRCSERDRKMAARLLAITQRDRESFFTDLQQAQHDLAGLGSEELLRKDYKQWPSPLGSYGISTVLLSLASWQQREVGLSEAVAQFAQDKDLEVFVVMLASQEVQFKREIIIFCRQTEIQASLEIFLENKGLDLTVIEGDAVLEGGLVRIYSQGNISISRKKLQPLIQSFLTGPA